jgi:hypothetical protein
MRRIMEPAMARPYDMHPEPQAVSLGRICLAQAIVSLSALTSTAALLAIVLPTMMSGLN